MVLKSVEEVSLIWELRSGDGLWDSENSARTVVSSTSKFALPLVDKRSMLLMIWQFWHMP